METISRYLLTFLLNSLWQIPLVAAVAMLARVLMRLGPAAYQHTVLVAAMIASLALPLASVRARERGPAMQLTVSSSQVREGLSHASAAPRPSLARLNPVRPRDTRSVRFPYRMALLFSSAYLIFMLFGAARWIRAWRRTVQITGGAERRTTPPLVACVWTRCARAFKIRNVELLWSSRITTPVTAGWLRPRIVIPDSLLLETSEDIIGTAIGHEMAHVVRRDFALRLLYELIYLPISFHPAAWLIRRSIEDTREAACDELVTRKLMNRSVYARSLAALATTAASSSGAAYTLGVFEGGRLETRIRRLIEMPRTGTKRARILLVAGLSALAACAIVAAGLSLTAHAQTNSYGELQSAGTAYNAGDFKAAVQHFSRAAELDPTNLNTKLFLANALLREYFVEKRQPGDPLIQNARRQYQAVLASNPNSRQALQGLMAIAINGRQPVEARDWALKLIQSDPGDKTGYYTVGVLDWASVYEDFVRAKQAAGGKQEDYAIADAALRTQFRDGALPRIDEGMRMLQTALQLDAKYDDAMAYLNLFYRLKAATVDSATEAHSLIATADEWVGKALTLKRQHSPATPQNRTQLDLDAPPPGPAGANAIVLGPPAPPPPPPPPNVAAQQPASSLPSPQPRTAAMPGQYWQVTGSSNVPAIDLFRKLRANGFSAMLFEGDDKLVRVMAGPYADAESIEDARSKLENAGFHPLRVW